MPIRMRREREQAERELAEAEGWNAVTARYLATGIEYSQPVLYSHFQGQGDPHPPTAPHPHGRRRPRHER